MAKTIVEELIGLVGLEVDEASFQRGSKALDNVKKQYDRVASAATRLGVAAAAVAGFTVVTNKLTAEQERMADAVGISSTALEAYGFIAKQAGLSTDNVVDLVEELNNKLGESKGLEEITAVREATEILGLEFDKLRKLQPEQQFFEILNAAKQLEDQQKAVSAADILMGGEANKFIGLLRSQDEGLQELIDNYTRLNLLTQDSRDASVAFNKSFGQFTTIIGSATKQLAALLGRGLKPVLDAIVEWTAENKELAQTIIRVFSVVIPVALGIAGVAVAALTVKLIAMGLALLGVTWPVVAIAAGIGLVVAAVGLLIEDIVTFIKHGDEANTVIGAMVRKVKELWQAFMNSTAITTITDSINSAIDSVRSLITWLNNLGASIGSGIFEAVEAVRGFSFDGFGFGGSELATAGGSTVNNTTNMTNSFQIDATGMDSRQLNEAIDSRVNQQNALAVNANSTGIER